MLQTLLWSCPICKTHDSIEHSERRFGNDRVACSACDAQWELIRVVGGPDFRLRLVSEDNGQIEKPLSKWYDQMMSDLTFQLIENPSWSHLENRDPDENLYLHSHVLLGFASPDDPIFQYPDLDFPNLDFGPAGLRPVGSGQLFFTSYRLLFLLTGNIEISLPWDDLKSVDTVMDKLFNVGFPERLFSFAFVGQSVLKWLAYTRLWIHLNCKGDGHRIYQGFI
jgi:hypothetical protein